MEINKVKLARQRQVIQRWKDNRARGTFEGVTGFGKTFVAILIIQEMNTKRPERTAHVVTPTRYLKTQWENLVKKFKLKNVTVDTVHTTVKAPMKCDLLILDEIHNYASAKFKSVFRIVKYKFILGLTATLERKDNRHVILKSYCPIIDTVDMQEALDNGYVSDFRVFNLGIELNEEDRKEYKKIGDQFYRFFAKFGHDFNAAMSCLSDPTYAALYDQRMGWEEGEARISAIHFNRNMAKRKKFLYYAESKVDTAVEIIKQFKVPTMTFSEATEFADSLTNKLPKICRSYHSKMPKKVKNEVISSFQDGRTSVRVINTAKALDEGFDISGVELAIICSGTSSERQDLQRTGRAIRYSEGKLGMIINLYIKNTQDEKWLRARQKKTKNVVYVKSIDEIKEIVNTLKLTL